MIIHLRIRSLFVVIGGSISKKNKGFMAQGEGEVSTRLLHVCTYILYNTVHECMYV